MKYKGLKIFTGVTLVSAGIVVAREVYKNKELTSKIKEEGKKIIDSTKILTKAVSKAANESVTTAKNNFEEKNPEIVDAIKATGNNIKEKGKEFLNKIKVVNEDEFVEDDEIICNNKTEDTEKESE